MSRRQRPIDIWRDAIRRSDMPFRRRAVAAHLGWWYVNTEHLCAWPGIERLVRETGVPKTSVIRALNELVATGWLVKVSRGHAFGAKGNGVASMYRAVLPYAVHDHTNDGVEWPLSLCHRGTENTVDNTVDDGGALCQLDIALCANHASSLCPPGSLSLNEPALKGRGMNRAAAPANRSAFGSASPARRPRRPSNTEVGDFSNIPNGTVIEDLVAHVREQKRKGQR